MERAIMRAMVLSNPGAIESNPLKLRELETPNPGPGKFAFACRRAGSVEPICMWLKLSFRRGGRRSCRAIRWLASSTRAARQRIDSRRAIASGIAWLRYTCGQCRYCKSGNENLCPNARFTGYDENGGFAEYAVVLEDFAYALPAAIDAASATPLLCAGIIGYRA